MGGRKRQRSRVWSGLGRASGRPPRRAPVHPPRRRLGVRSIADRSACVAEATRSAVGGSSSNLGIQATAPGRPRLIPCVRRTQAAVSGAFEDPLVESSTRNGKGGPMAGRLDGRVAIITGAGHGIGRAYAHGMAREGARVLVAEIDAKAGDVVAAELKTLGHDAVAVR